MALVRTRIADCVLSYVHEYTHYLERFGLSRAICLALVPGSVVLREFHDVIANCYHVEFGWSVQLPGCDVHCHRLHGKHLWTRNFRIWFLIHSCNSRILHNVY